MGQSKPLQIGIQGIKASFHDVAARKYFSASGRQLNSVECVSFKTLCMALRDGVADYCLMAIENSIAGSILTNYNLLEQYGLKIIGEVYLRIEMNLMAVRGQRLEALTLVRSHPMALSQCDDFLASHPWLKAMEAADTAESAKEIAEQMAVGQGAIASALAAETYGLEILAAGIETNKQNYTRFLVICREADYLPAVDQRKANKASLRFEVVHEPGSLARVLQILARHHVNMTKIQSVPILGKPYQYSFHVDVEWNKRENYDAMLADIGSTRTVTSLIRFGEYPKGERVFI